MPRLEGSARVTDAHYPYPAPIDAYGNGGFRFAGMSHQGSILCLPTGIYAWPVATAAALTPDDFAAVLALGQWVSFLLLGSGPNLVLPTPDIRKAFIAAGIGIESMNTGAAARTYNVLLAEGRRVAAGLLAVD